MFARLLIANRGEIAVRIARTAHNMGIGTVGVFSEADRTALHTRSVDRAVALGGNTPAESYLRGDAVIEAAVSTGCDAIHPGYGFLAENAEFARAVEAAGLVFVGPTPEQIELLGDKLAAKAEAVEAGVPTTQAVEVTADSVRSGAIGGLPLPAMVKAAAGGGGRGMRVVTEAAEMAEVVASASREAEAAFGDGRVFVEPLIEHGRHVEVQVLGDTHGNVVHLGERDCSIQRRHQKVVEEAPSPGIGEATRRALCDGAVALARRVSYRGAGTVEFLVGDDGTISFLEVNTRLQVEHPVTEAVWGVDLVELQLVVAAGDPLPLSQQDLEPRGHAIEVRIVAEDPSAGWIPSTGTLDAFDIQGLRVDSGFEAGSVVSPDYDSLLAKVISHSAAGDSSRLRAAARLGRALRTADISGVRTNTDTLAAIVGEADFLAGAATTSYLEEHPEVTAAAGPEGDERVAHLVAAAVAQQQADRDSDNLWGFAPSGWRNVATTGQRRTFAEAGAQGATEQLEYRVVSRPGEPSVEAEVRLGPPPEPGDDGVLTEDTRRVVTVVATPLGGNRWLVDLDGVARHTAVDRSGDGALRVRSAGGSTTWVPLAPFTDHDASDAAGGPVSPLPGSVVSVHVAAGDEVADGDLLVVVEAMKMEHRIVATADATVTEVLVGAGDKVDAGDLLVALESA